MRTTARLLVMFVLFNLFNWCWALKTVPELNWEKSPQTAWPLVLNEDYSVLRIIILLLNKPNYLDNGLEKTFIATGVLLDNSRILTSYNPFRELIGSSKLTDNILALLPTGMKNELTELRIANLVCGRQIAFDPHDEYYWQDSPLHDLMVIRIEEEIGTARHPNIWDYIHDVHSATILYWTGPLRPFETTYKSFPAGPNDQIGTELLIFSLGHRNKKEMRHYDIIIRTDYEGDDAVLADCEEWLPRHWGFFICIRNIDNFPGLGSGAVLFSKHKVFGIGSFTLFKNNMSILVFTDVRPYGELISKTCGIEEFT